MPLISNFSDLVFQLESQLKECVPVLSPTKIKELLNDPDLIVNFERLKKNIPDFSASLLGNNSSKLQRLLKLPCTTEHQDNIKEYGLEYFEKLNLLLDIKPATNYENWLFSIYEYFLSKNPHLPFAIESFKANAIRFKNADLGQALPKRSIFKGRLKKTSFVYDKIIKPWIDRMVEAAADQPCGSSDKQMDYSLVNLNDFINKFAQVYQRSIHITKQSPSYLKTSVINFILEHGNKHFKEFCSWHSDKDWKDIEAVEITEQRLRAFGVVLTQVKEVNLEKIKNILLSDGNCILVNLVDNHQRHDEITSLISNIETSSKITKAISLDTSTMQKHALDLLLFYPSDRLAKEIIEHLNLTSYAGNSRNRNLAKTLEITSRIMASGADPEWIWDCIFEQCKHLYHYMALEAMVNAGIEKHIIGALLQARGEHRFSEQCAFLIIALDQRKLLTQENINRIFMPKGRKLALSEVKALQSQKNNLDFKQLALALDVLLKSDQTEKRKPYYMSIQKLLEKSYDFSCSTAIRPKNRSHVHLSLEDIERYWDKNGSLPFITDDSFHPDQIDLAQFDPLQWAPEQFDRNSCDPDKPDKPFKPLKMIDPKPIWQEKIRHWCNKYQLRVEFPGQSTDIDLAKRWQALQFVEQVVLDLGFCWNLLNNSVESLMWIEIFSALYSQGLKVEASFTFESCVGFEKILNQMKKDKLITKFHEKTVDTFKELKKLGMNEGRLKAYVSLNEEQKLRFFNILVQINQSLPGIKGYLNSAIRSIPAEYDAWNALKKELLEISIEQLTSENHAGHRQTAEELAKKLNRAQRTFFSNPVIEPSKGLRDALRYICNTISLILAGIPFVLNYIFTGNVGFFAGSGAEHKLDCLQEKVEKQLIL